MSQIAFQTARLHCRRICHADVHAMLAVYGNTDVVRYVGEGMPLDRSGCERWIEVTLQNYAERGYGMFALIERESREIVGFCGLVHPSDRVEPEIKYALHPNQWGKGLATEAAMGLLSFAENIGIRKVVATVHPSNASSKRVLIKAGMTQCGDSPHNSDGSEDLLFYWSPVSPTK